MIQFDLRIFFQMGWFNHQLVIIHLGCIKPCIFTISTGDRRISEPSTVLLMGPLTTYQSWDDLIRPKDLINHLADFIGLRFENEKEANGRASLGVCLLFLKGLVEFM